MSKRGYTALLVLFVFAAATAAGVVFASRLSVNQNARRAEAVRLQALWLGRSACEARLTSPRRVRTEVGEAALSRSGTAVTVELSGSRATVDCTTREERFTAR